MARVGDSELEPYDLSMPKPLLRAPRAGDCSRLARIWLDGAAYFAAIDPTLFQIPATETLAEWLEHLALHITPEDTYMPPNSTAMSLAISGLPLDPDPDSARQMLRDACIARLTVHWLGIANLYRRQGIGTRLLEAAQTWAISRGVRVAGFSTYLGATAPRCFYQRRGYARQAVYFRKAHA